ncbi:MAG: hypothetical protein E7279_00675 [Lachnospiraceae bacterium]|nr:hypothetical protein [Lachnospiraceae bacterium]
MINEIMRNDIMNLLIPSITSVIGVFIGFGLNLLSSHLMNKPKLSIAIKNTQNDLIDDIETRTNTGNSEYSVEVFNIGQKHIIIDYFELYYKKGIIVPCHIDENDRVISPNNFIRYVLMEEDKSALMHYCSNEMINKCYVRVYLIDKKIINYEIDLSLFELENRLSETDGIVE